MRPPAEARPAVPGETEKGISAETVAAMFRRAAKRGACPTAAQCAPLARFLNEENRRAHERRPPPALSPQERRLADRLERIKRALRTLRKELPAVINDSRRALLRAGADRGPAWRVEAESRLAGQNRLLAAVRAAPFWIPASRQGQRPAEWHGPCLSIACLAALVWAAAGRNRLGAEVKSPLVAVVAECLHYLLAERAPEDGAVARFLQTHPLWRTRLPPPTSAQKSGGQKT